MDPMHRRRRTRAAALLLGFAASVLLLLSTHGHGALSAPHDHGTTATVHAADAAPTTAQPEDGTPSASTVAPEAHTGMVDRAPAPTGAAGGTALAGAGAWALPLLLLLAGVRPSARRPGRVRTHPTTVGRDGPAVGSPDGTPVARHEVVVV